jgi:hypothetical protein
MAAERNAARKRTARRFTLGTQSCTNTTNSSGVASCSIILNQTPGPYTVTASFAGSGNYLASSASVAFKITQPPTITSANKTTFTTGSASTFTVTTTGYPIPALNKTGSLPSGVTFTDNGNGTATISGTPAAGTGGTYPITITASNGILPNATQSFTLTIDQPPHVTSLNYATFIKGIANSFTVTTTGFPVPALRFSPAGSLPPGVTFVDNHNGTATISGKPTVSGLFTFWIETTNGVSPPGFESFSLTVKP